MRNGAALLESICSLEGVITDSFASPGDREDKVLQLITVKMSDIYVSALDKLVDLGMYPSRSEAIRVAIRDLLMKELWVDGMPVTKELGMKVEQ